MSYRRKFPRKFISWHCKNCGSTGITGGKDELNLIRGICRHHHEKSRNCRFRRKNIEIHRPHATPVIEGFNPLGFAIIRLKTL